MRSLVLALALLASAPASAAGTLHFIQDDYARALADARARNVPLVVEARALRAAGDVLGAKTAVDEAIHHGEGLPEAVRPRGVLKAARTLRDELDREAKGQPVGPAKAAPGK